MRQIGRTLTLLIASTLLTACAGKQAPEGGGTFASRDLLTREQILEARVSNAYDAVERLRSRWLRMRGTTQVPSHNGGPQFRDQHVLAYLDDQKLGSIEALRTVETAAIQYIRFYSAAEAAGRWGFNHGGGVVFVSTRPLER